MAVGDFAARRGRGAVAMCSALLLAAGRPHALDAQGGITPTARYTLTPVGAENLCAQEEREGARLARLPEGLALLRMRSELEAASRLATVRPAEAGAVRRLTVVRREVDSLATVLERVVLAAPRRNAPITETEARLLVHARVRQLTPQVEALVESALRRVTPSPAPEGYFGVTISSVPLRTSLQSGYIVSYCDYPVIESVDPGSPAERAGLSAGDTIVAFNGRDVRAGMVDYTALLAPDAKIGVRTRRDGRTRESTVRVEARAVPVPVRAFARSLQGTVSTPRVAGTRITANTVPSVTIAAGAVPAGVEISSVRASQAPVAPMGRAPTAVQVGDVWFPLPAAMRDQPSTRWQYWQQADSSARVMVFSRENREPGVPAAASVAPPAPPSPVMLTIFANADDAMVGGAQLRTLSAEFRAALSLPEGVLVMQVLRGTPASAGGLREGDVIRAVNGRAVQRVDDVRVALASGSATRTLTFRVVRNDAPERTVTMRW